jgi:two-component system, cell cycle sensor histidine kinase and response regulator CckA
MLPQNVAWESKPPRRNHTLNVVMPYLDGAGTIRALQRLNPQVKVIATSGLNTTEKVSGARNLLGVPLLEKPFTASALLAKLGEILE